MSEPSALPSIVAGSEYTGRTAAPGIFLPKEHGSWSLAFEPLVLGLLVAPSVAGGALASAFIAGFFARRPLKIATAGGPAQRRRMGQEALVILVALALAGLVEAALLGGWHALWPLALVALPAALFLHLDTRNQSRAMAAELAGSAAFAFAPVAFAALAGWPAANALVLAAVMLARSWPTVWTVRYCLRVAKGRAVGVGPTILPVVSALAGFFALARLASTRLVPSVAPWLALFLVFRAVYHAVPRRPAWPARRVGISEAVLGGLYVVIIGLAWPHP